MNSPYSVLPPALNCNRNLFVTSAAKRSISFTPKGLCNVNTLSPETITSVHSKRRQSSSLILFTSVSLNGFSAPKMYRYFGMTKGNRRRGNPPSGVPFPATFTLHFSLQRLSGNPSFAKYLFLCPSAEPCSSVGHTKPVEHNLRLSRLHRRANLHLISIYLRRIGALEEPQQVTLDAVNCIRRNRSGQPDMILILRHKNIPEKL